MTIYLMTDTKTTPCGDDPMRAIYEAEELRDRTGKRVAVVRLRQSDAEPTDICTFLGADQWIRPAKEGAPHAP